MSLPTTPTGLTATAGYGCVQLQWKAPSSSPSVTGYTVTITPTSPDLPPIVLSSTAPYKPPVVLTVGRLDTGATYAFTVAATNADGTSAASVAVTATPVDFKDGLMNALSFLTGELSNDFITRLGLNPPVMWIGPQYLANRDDGQRLVFVPEGGPIVPGELLGDDDFYSAGPGDPPAQPRQIWDSEETVAAHIWGLQLPTADPMEDTLASYAQARFLSGRMLATIHRLAIGSTISTSAMYPEHDKTTRGAAMVTKFQLKIPVVRYTDSTGVITGFTPVTTEIEDPP